MCLINRLYYTLKPLFPRSAQIMLRRTVIKIRLKNLKMQDIWPINKAASDPPPNWKGWPEGKKFALLLTHDVETQKGMGRCRPLAEIDLKYGFKSSFNIVPFKYDIPSDIHSWLLNNGLEVGVHDYNHDGKLYSSKEVFEQRAVSINDCIKKWNASGFRSASMHHNLDWIANLNILYDCSTFDTDPFEPQSDGVNTIFPFWYQQKCTERGFVEIPYTLPQDFTLFILKKEKDCKIWKDKLKWIAEKGGMATVIIHPDYINFDNNDCKIDEYSSKLYIDFLECIRNEFKGQYWNPLPKEFALFIKNSRINTTTSLFAIHN